MNSMGWSRRDPDIPVNTSSQNPLLSRIQSLNPFGSGGGYVRLPTQENPGAPLPAPTRREEEEGWFARKSTSVPTVSPSGEDGAFLQPVICAPSRRAQCLFCPFEWQSGVWRILPSRASWWCSSSLMSARRRPSPARGEARRMQPPV